MRAVDVLMALEELASATAAAESRIEDAQRELDRVQRLIWTLRHAALDALAKEGTPSALAKVLLEALPGELGTADRGG